MCGPRPSLPHPTLHVADNLALPTKSSRNIGAEAVSAFFGQLHFLLHPTQHRHCEGWAQVQTIQGRTGEPWGRPDYLNPNGCHTKAAWQEEVARLEKTAVSWAQAINTPDTKKMRQEHSPCQGCVQWRHPRASRYTGCPQGNASRQGPGRIRSHVQPRFRHGQNKNGQRHNWDAMSCYGNHNEAQPCNCVSE